MDTLNRDAGNLGIYGALPDNAKVEIISGQEEPVVQGWIPRGKPYECQPLPTAVYKTTGGGVTELTYVVCPIAKGELSPISYIERLSAGPGLSGGRIAMMDGRAIHYGMRLSPDGPAVSGDFSVDSDVFVVVESADGVVSSIHSTEGVPVMLDGGAVEVGQRVGPTPGVGPVPEGEAVTQTEFDEV